MEYLKLAIVDSENYNNFAHIFAGNFDRVIVFTNSQELESNFNKTEIYHNFELVPIIYGEGNKDNMDGYICAKVGEYVEPYRDFRTYLSITIFSNDRIFRGIASYYTRKGFNIATTAPTQCDTGTSNTDPKIRIKKFLDCHESVVNKTFKKHFNENNKDAFYRLIRRHLDKDIPRQITDLFVENNIIFFSNKSRKIGVGESKYNLL
ncbi:PIN domain-containing protein [Francisella tularensis]|uniref:hypothetical protein n=1 Tax=Francisella tularensis TaxID=263 RepID=UPI000173E2F2|nr:hypothetical protein [Francisella tularensis]ACD30654.1 conserved hypothetical protein [Francisella tularensis subsp. mediasiatica FSC147]MBK2078390.1 hypothetical protein [Francisella tularensis subsp. mediasiatica]MBK2102154.1 hypothetical protein [Francisella tularensis subsp. mediasiatica]MBK2104448.1 hypothetical protein [Francisella tularensis subsp. mediasiatica]MDN9003029.1 hypothetical protein [Francisella tularensis subsp. mediasiatica]